LLTVHRLKKGPRANVLVGLEGDYFIGLEGVSVNLLAYYSPYAKQKLVDERAKAFVVPNGYKEPMVWIYKYMQAGEKDPQGLQTFESLSFDDLAMLHRHAARLQYGDLMGRIVGRMKGKFKDELPSVRELKTFKDAIPPLYEYAITVLADEMSDPWTANYTSYLTYAKEDTAFGDALGLAMKTLIAARVKRSEEYYTRFANKRGIALSNEYYAQRANARESGEAAKETNKSATKQSGPRRTRGSKNKTSMGSTATTDDLPGGRFSSRSSKTREPFNCYNCGGEGHIWRNCKAEPKAKKPTFVKEPFLCYNCDGEGHLSRDCKADPKAKTSVIVKEPFLCYNCDGEGHLSRDCPKPRKNYEVRRQQRDPGAVLIELPHIGGGNVRTCQREVRKGERTRTGLVI
jgi:hypothetical protein